MSNDIILKDIEEKWQKKWLKDKNLKTNLDNHNNKKYVLTMFSYPSGDKLHIGHWYNYGPVDTFARFLKMNGFNIFQPQGFDAFGLPAENFAIKHGIHPKESTNKNISVMREQLKKIGAMFDWDNEVVTSNEEYYKWTQWLFLQLYNNKLAYRDEAMVNWDPIDQTVLANEQVLSDGTSERSGARVIQKPLKQWFFKITNYADELLNFDTLNWPNKTKLMQNNWIGKSDGAIIEFPINGINKKIKAFTTRADTLYGATYLVLSPEHELVKSCTIDKFKSSVNNYCKKSALKSEIERLDTKKTKTGAFTGLYAINPINNKQLPVWIADYVLTGYGTGAIMAVPGHDSRDYEFAKKYNLEIIEVVKSSSSSDKDEIYTGDGIAINSDIIEGLSTKEAKQKIISYLEEHKLGKRHTNYKLKDWLISRQRYWGAPIPIVYDPKGNAHPIPERYLPWILPDDVEYKPKGTSPLGSSKELIERTEKIFGKGWRPEIDTMDTFVCSSWYYLRYPDSKNTKNAFTNKSNSWLPVDYYIGGSEHATMHLLYARFITKCLRDLGYLNFDEPFKNLFHQGTITKDGSKMSKSKGNTVSPDSFIDKYGSDTFRCYLMFMGPFDEGGDWNDKGIKGIDRFLHRSYRLVNKENKDNITSKDEYIFNHTIDYITKNMYDMKFNTCLSKLMEFVNHFYETGLPESYKIAFVKLLSPFAPHLSEELWSIQGKASTIFIESWPKSDESKLAKTSIDIAVQVNGKVRAIINIESGDNKENVLNKAKENQKVKKYLENKKIKKEIYIPGKIINFVVY